VYGTYCVRTPDRPGFAVQWQRQRRATDPPLVLLDNTQSIFPCRSHISPPSPPLALIPFVPPSSPLPYNTSLFAQPTMSLRIADDADGHGLVSSPTTSHSPHLPSHPTQQQQPVISASSSNNSPNVAISSRPSLSSKSSSSPPRSSTEVDLATKPSPSSTARWRNSLPPSAQRAEAPSAGAQGGASPVVEPSFDENVLRALCDLDVSSFTPNQRYPPAQPVFSPRTHTPLSPSVGFLCYLTESNRA